MHKVLMWIVVM